MFRLCFLLLAVIGVAMLVGGREPTDPEKTVLASAQPAAEAPSAQIAAPAVLHARPASVDALLGTGPAPSALAAAPVAGVPAAGTTLAASATGSVSGSVSGSLSGGQLSAPDRLGAGEALLATPRPREFGSVGTELASMASVREEVAAALADATVAYVSGNRVNVRSGPSTDYGVVGQVTFGEATEILSEDQSGWVQIRIQGDGIEGYISSRFLQDSDPNG